MDKQKISDKRKDYLKEYRQKNKEKLKQYHTEYNKKNKEKIKEYHQENKEKTKEYKKTYNREYNRKRKEKLNMSKRRISPDIKSSTYDIIEAVAIANDRKAYYMFSKILNDWAEAYEKKNKPKVKKEVVQVESTFDAEAAFDQIWVMYEKKGNRKGSLAKFSKLSHETMQLIFDHVPKYVKSTPEKQFRKNFETYINQECWMDEINESSKPVKPLSSYEESMQQLGRLHQSSESIEPDAEENNGILGNDAAGLF